MNSKSIFFLFESRKDESNLINKDVRLLHSNQKVENFKVFLSDEDNALVLREKKKKIY